MTVEFKQAEPEDIAVMKQFGDIISQGMALLGDKTTNNFSSIVAQKLQEAMQWFSHGILNKPIVNAAIDAAEVAGAVTGNATLSGVAAIASEVQKDAAADANASAAAPVTPTPPTAS